MIVLPIIPIAMAANVRPNTLVIPKIAPEAIPAVAIDKPIDNKIPSTCFSTFGNTTT